jgi:hypothetical protein
MHHHRGRGGCADIAQQTYRVIFGGLFSCKSYPINATLHHQLLEDDMEKFRQTTNIQKARDGPNKNTLLDTCADCHGEGKINGETCARCQGRGISPVRRSEAAVAASFFPGRFFQRRPL